MTVDRQRQEAQLAFILHTYPYRETSLVAEVFTRNFGRLPLLAKGARRPHSPLRGLLRPFQPLQLSWGGSRNYVCCIKPNGRAVSRHCRARA